MKAKDFSLISKIVAGVILIGGHVAKWLGWLPNATSTEICTCAFSIMGVFGTIDLNIALDKFTGRA